MEITLHNIGVIQDASIKLDGLTVITGKNESGKTTVGKALYALLDAVSDLPQKVQADKSAYILNRLQSLSRESNLFNAIDAVGARLVYSSGETNMKADYPNLLSLASFDVRSHSVVYGFDAEAFAHKVEDELRRFQRLWDDDKRVLSDDVLQTYLRRFSFYLRGVSFIGENANADQNTTVINAMRSQIAKDVQFMERLLAEIDRDPLLIHYVQESITQTLNTEFSNQIQTIGSNEKISAIRIISGKSILHFDLKIEGNRVANDGFFHSPFGKAYFIDNPFVLDQTPFGNHLSSDGSMETDSYFNPNQIQGHAIQLSRILHSRQRPSVLEQTILDGNLRPLKEHMDKVIPGTFDFSQKEEYYIRDDGVKLRVSNMAAGSKMFSIIKILLDRGLLDEDAMLILDEPETHLHPQWQNQFAEMIVLLVKELRVKVLLTTHSSHFMLAIDAYMRKHKINDMANFYQARRLDNGYVTHDCVNDRMEVIYQDFLESFSEVKALRDYYDTDGDDES